MKIIRAYFFAIFAIVFFSIVFVKISFHIKDSFAATTVVLNDDGQGKALYQKYCALCHGNDAIRSPRQGIGPILFMELKTMLTKLLAYKKETNDFDFAKKPMVDITKQLANHELESIVTYIGILRNK